MNKILKIIVASLGGINAVLTISLPILVALLWVNFSGLEGWSSYALLTAGILASVFRGFKIGFMNKDD